MRKDEYNELGRVWLGLRNWGLDWNKGHCGNYMKTHVLLQPQKILVSELDGSGTALNWDFLLKCSPQKVSLMLSKCFYRVGSGVRESRNKVVMMGKKMHLCVYDVEATEAKHDSGAVN